MVYWVKTIDIWELRDKINADAKKPGFDEQKIYEETKVMASARVSVKIMPQQASKILITAANA